MEIEIGEYVRTLDGIKKIIKANKGIERTYRGQYEIEPKYKGSYCISEKNIIKHSKNIIDLIEVGDYVNGRKIERINDYGDFKRADFNLDYDDCDAVYNEDIKTILTHEQFKENCYRLEE